MGSRSATAVSSGVRVDVLGPVAVSVDGVVRQVTARRQRAVLACLALDPGEAVSADRLLEEVWGDDLPETGRRAVPFQIAKLRSSLEPDRDGEGTLITTSPGGYVLHVEPDGVDAVRFERLVSQARELVVGDPAGCEQLVVEALGLWRGRAFADLGDEPFVDRECRRLEQLHMVGRRTLAEARIGVGRAGEVIGDLERLVDEYPLDETLVELLMTALDRSGRTADALRVYGMLRRRLSEELGIEPSHELQRLEQELLSVDDAQRPQTPLAGPKGVPAAMSSFVGRTEEIVGIEDWLSSARLVTICGFGGLGKTRLAQEVARRVGDRFDDGVWYVDLAPIADASVVARTITAAGGLIVPAGRDAVDHLSSWLADREVLVVLDNCEHLAAAVAEVVTRILESAPRVRVLATSRVRLGVAGERVWMLRPLGAEPAVELFADRARLVRPGFVLDDTGRNDFGRLADRLDRVPLAIEMAAARLAVMGIDQIVEYLDDRFRLLTHSGRGGDARQESMVAVLDWSYHLLDERDQVLLRRMSVCVGGFDLDAANRIGSPDPSEPLEVLDHLGHLVEASLVVFDAGRGTPRYRMLETVRQFAADKLDADERNQAGLSHARHYDSVAAAIFDQMDAAPGAATVVAERELGNLRAAMSWAYHNAHPRLGLSIARYVKWYFHTQLMDRELLGWLNVGLDLVDDDEPDTLEAAAGASHAASNVNDHDGRDRAVARIERGIGAVGDPSLRAELLSGLGSKSSHTDPRRAADLMNEASELRASVPNRAMALLSNRVELSWHGADLDDGEAILQRLAEILAMMPTADWGRCKVEAGVAAWAGRWDDVVRIAGAANNLEPVSESWLRLLHAEALGALGRHDDALAVLEPLNPDALGYYFHFADLVHAAIDLQRHEPELAAQRLSALADAITRDGRRVALGMHVAALLAIAADDVGQHETAAILFGYADAEKRRLDISLRPSGQLLADRAIEFCRATLGPQRFEVLFAEGATTEWSDLPRVDSGAA